MNDDVGEYLTPIMTIIGNKKYGVKELQWMK